MKNCHRCRLLFRPTVTARFKLLLRWGIMILLPLAFLSIATQPAMADGLHNSTKEFTSPDKMSEKDWANPDEIQRTWDAALVRIPLGSAKVIETSMNQLNDVSTMCNSTRLCIAH